MKRVWVPTLAAVMLAAALPVAQATDESAETNGLEIWNDPTFQKHFMASWGVNAELEPRVTAVEREQMEQILQMMQESNVEGAIEALNQAITPDRKQREAADPSAVFDFTLGNVYFQREDFEQAAVHYENALAKFPSFRRAHKNLGLIHVRTGEFEKAIGPLSRVVELGGGDGLVFGLLGYAYSSTGQYVAAESAYRSAVLLEPNVVDWKLGLTLSVLKQQRYGEAVTLCEELLGRFPERTDYWLLQANAYIGLGKPLKAVENFEIVRRMGKATPQSLQTLGDIYVNENLWDLAADAYRGAVELNPDQAPSGPLRNVEVLAQRGAVPQARSLLASVKHAYQGRLDDEQQKKLLKLEARMAVAEGESGEAAGVLEEIVALDPLDGEALILLGQHYARIDQPDRAVFYYERAESLEEFESEASVRHAQLLVAQNRYGEALPLLKRAQEIDPRDDVARYIEQVERVARAQR
jgi:tetratricopeptide (TPR) repeat protein